MSSEVSAELSAIQAEVEELTRKQKVKLVFPRGSPYLQFYLYG